jgi:hypothetical protein
MGNGWWKPTKMRGFHDSHGINQLIYEESSSFFLGPKVREVFTQFTWLGLEGYSLIFHGEQVTSGAQDSQVGEHKQLNSWVYGQKYRIYGGYEVSSKLQLGSLTLYGVHHREVASPFR